MNHPASAVYQVKILYKRALTMFNRHKETSQRQPACAKHLFTLFTLHEDVATQSNNHESETQLAPLKKDHIMQEQARVRRWEELQKLEQLLKENAVLRRQILFYEKVWYEVMNILHEIYETKVLAQKALKTFDKTRAATEQGWLAYWDSPKKAAGNLEPHSF